MNAVYAVVHGESMLNKEIVVHLLRHMENEMSQEEELPSGRLSQRELEVLQLLTQGLTNREIAQRLYLSVSTVKIHVEHILAKLRASDRTQAAVRAIELGLLHPVSRE
jgi:DNA-binding NarL/FixJ family response regulator